MFNDEHIDGHDLYETKCVCVCCIVWTLPFGEIEGILHVICFMYAAVYVAFGHCAFVLKYALAFFPMCVCRKYVYNIRLYMDLTLDTMHLIFMFRILCAIAVILCVYVYCSLLILSKKKKMKWNAYEFSSLA